MIHLFRHVGSEDADSEKASRRYDDAYEDLRAALHLLLTERNQNGRPPMEDTR